MLSCGDCFLAGEDEEEKLHLRVIATPPAADGCVVVVSVTTLRRNSESLVLIDVGDHPFIRHKSTVSFRYAEINWISAIEAAISTGSAKHRGKVDGLLLKRIQNGLIESDFTPNGVRHFAKEILGA